MAEIKSFLYGYSRNEKWQKSFPLSLPPHDASWETLKLDGVGKDPNIYPDSPHSQGVWNLPHKFRLYLNYYLFLVVCPSLFSNWMYVFLSFMLSFCPSVCLRFSMLVLLTLPPIVIRNAARVKLWTLFQIWWLSHIIHI